MTGENTVQKSSPAYKENGLLDWKLGREGEGFNSPPLLPVSLLCVQFQELLFGFLDSWKRRGGSND